LPGIGLVVDTKSDVVVARQKLDTMLRLISRESWHVTRKGEAPPLFVGRVDLQESEETAFPLWVTDGDLYLSLVGQFHITDVERQNLSKEAGAATALTDPYLAMSLYKKKGLKFLDMVRGVFATAIWCASERKLTVANDRLGRHQIFYRSWPGGIAVCSEAKGPAWVGAGGTEKPKPDAQGFIDLFNFAYVCGDRTLYGGVNLLPIAGILTWQDEKCEVKKYWELWYKDPAPIRPDDELAEQLASLIKMASRALFNEKNRPVVTISAGLDCRLAAVSLPSELTGLTALTWGKPGSSDAKIGGEVAKLLGFHHVVAPTPHEEFLDRFIKVVDIIDGQFYGDASVRNINLEKQRELGFTFCFGHNYIGFHKPPPPDLDDVRLAEHALRARRWDVMSRFVRPEHRRLFFEGRRRALDNVLSRPLPTHYLTKHQFIDDFEFRRRFQYMAGIVMRNTVDVRMPISSYEIVDMDAELAPTQRVDRKFYIKTLSVLLPEAARIKYGNTGAAPSMPFWLQHYLATATKVRRRLLYPVQKLTHIPMSTTVESPDANWVALYMTDQGLLEKVRALLLSPDSLTREYLLPEEVQRYLCELKAGLHRDAMIASIFLTMELALRRLFG
jgi:hypothetical protein